MNDNTQDPNMNQQPGEGMGMPSVPTTPDAGMPSAPVVDQGMPQDPAVPAADPGMPSAPTGDAGMPAPDMTNPVPGSENNQGGQNM